MQILLDAPSQDNYIVIPDGSGIFVIEALAPLYLDTAGTVYLAQDEIVHVSQLVAGSIGRTFGKSPLFFCLLLFLLLVRLVSSSVLSKFMKGPVVS